MGWVWQHSRARGVDRYTHVALADVADDDGYSRGDEFASLNQLVQRMGTRKERIQKAITNLEEIGELLVYRPDDRDRGRHNEYVVLRGRDPLTVARARGWPISVAERSGRRTATKIDAPGSAPTDRRDGGAMDGPSTPQQAHRGAQAAPPATCGPPATGPVDDESAPSDQSVRHADHPDARSVRDRSAIGPPGGSLSMYSSSPKDLTGTACSEPDRGRARDAVRPVDDPVEELLDRVARLAPGVRLNLTARQRAELTVHLAAWREAAAGVDALVDVAEASIGRYGPPRTVQAWLGPWLGLTPPAIDLDEAVCDEHPLGELRVPRRVCAMCHTERVAAKIAQ